MQTGAHLTREGAIKIALITEKMNHRKSRTELIRILRDYTPNSNDKTFIREDIVHSAYRYAVGDRNDHPLTF